MQPYGKDYVENVAHIIQSKHNELWKSHTSVPGCCSFGLHVWAQKKIMSFEHNYRYVPKVLLDMPANETSEWAAIFTAI